jgi:hypothetical protein
MNRGLNTEAARALPALPPAQYLAAKAQFMGRAEACLSQRA